MIDVDKEYIEPALREIARWAWLAPSRVQRQVNLAVSLLDTNKMVTSEELRSELGDKWVVARRTKSRVERYGKDTKFLSQKQYDAAQRRIIERRVK